MIDYTKEILESTKYVATNSEHVKINTDNIAKLFGDISLKEDTDWLKDSPIPLDTLSEKEKVHLMLAFNALSFSYWGDPSWRVTYNGTTYDRGSWGLLAALIRAREEGTDILDPKVQSNISKRDLEYVLRGNVEIPLLEQRQAIINQVGKSIDTKYKGDFRNMITQSNNNAITFLSTIIENFPSFEDAVEYNGRKISFYKRAQALVESVDSIIPLAESDKLTALADYKLPVPLREAGILSYSKELEQIIDTKTLIPAKSQYETEIRANTIWAVENIKKYLSDKGMKLNSKQINDYLWIIAAKYDKEHHRTRTTSY